MGLEERQRKGEKGEKRSGEGGWGEGGEKGVVRGIVRGPGIHK